MLRIHFLIPILIIGLITRSNAQEINVSPVRVWKAGFQFPTDITGDEQGHVYVLDGVRDRIVRLGLRGKPVLILPQRETIREAVGIDFQDGTLWIADTPRHRLVKMSPQGRVLDILTLGHLAEPVDVLATDDQLVATDRYNHSILVLDTDGRERYFWGGRGSQTGNFTNPGFLAAGPENRIVIGDILNRRVVSSTPSGQYLQVIARKGTNRGLVHRPKGIALDSQGRVWVADAYLGTLQAFSATGAFAGIAVRNGEPIRLTTPTGIWVDEEDRLWVVEGFINQVSVWSIE